jgi:hypothetical protein
MTEEINKRKSNHFLTNPANYSVVALRVKANGILFDEPITATGGAGMSGLDSAAQQRTMCSSAKEPSK